MRAGYSSHQPIGSELQEGHNLPQIESALPTLPGRRKSSRFKILSRMIFRIFCQNAHSGVRILTGIDTWLNLDEQNLSAANCWVSNHWLLRLRQTGWDFCWHLRWLRCLWPGSDDHFWGEINKMFYSTFVSDKAHAVRFISRLILKEFL